MKIALVQAAMIFPGTELEKIASQKGILSSDFSWCKAYEHNDLNNKLGQLSNCPLYNDGTIRTEFFEGVQKYLYDSLQRSENKYKEDFAHMSFSKLLSHAVSGKNGTGLEIKKRIIHAFLKALRNKNN